MIRGWAAASAVAVGLSLVASAPVARAQASDSDKAALEQRVGELEQELALLKRKSEVDTETQASKGPQPVIVAGSEGFGIRSADSKYVLKIRGYTHFDTRYFSDSASNRAPGTD